MRAFVRRCQREAPAHLASFNRFKKMICDYSPEDFWVLVDAERAFLVVDFFTVTFAEADAIDYDEEEEEVGCNHFYRQELVTGLALQQTQVEAQIILRELTPTHNNDIDQIDILKYKLPYYIRRTMHRYRRIFQQCFIQENHTARTVFLQRL